MANDTHPASPAKRNEVILGVIGGSGLYQMEALQRAEPIEVSTPFGDPSGPLTVGRLPRGSGDPPLRAVFIARHGPGHPLLPGEINYRANIHALKQLGVTHLVSVSAVGSLQESIAPGHIVCVDQFIDRTKAREASFFGQGIVAHVQFGDPTCDKLRGLLAAAARRAGATVHDKGTCVVMEGPAFSTRAESELYRSFGADVIGMTALPEAKLAREAELGYALMALSTDYDCWHLAQEEVSVEAVVAIVKQNVAVAQRALLELAKTLPITTEQLPYPRSCEHAVMTAPESLPAAARERLDLIIGHYL